MSHDGCIEVAWKGKPFPYLLHHHGFHSTENYGSAREAAAHHNQGHGPAPAAGSDTLTPAGTGTWNGPAPRGAGAAALQASTAGNGAATVVSEPQTVRLRTGAHMPIIGYGTAAVKVESAVRSALDAGYRHFDCAEAYNNEELVGRALSGWVSEQVAAGNANARQELFVTSKLHNTHHRPAAVRASAEASIKALGVGYLDLYLVHWPEAWLPGSEYASPVTDTEVTTQDTWRAMEQLVEDGLVRHIGVSNFSLKQIEDILTYARVPPSVHQIELHPLLAQRKLVGVCYRKGIQSVAYSPLGGQGFFRTNDLITHPTVAQVAAECGKTPAQVLLKWNLQRGVVVIPKASSPEHIKANLEGAFAWKLSNAQKALLDTLDCGKRFIDFDWKDWGSPEEGGITKPSKVL